MANAELRKAVETSLQAQLREKGADIAAFKELITDYMSLYDMKEKLVEDVEKRGITYTDYNVKGIEVQKENPSLKAMIMTNKQMLAILDKLDLKPATVINTEDDDNDL